MRQKDKDSQNSIFRKSEETDFVFFRTVEDTLQGILSFVVAYLRTSRTLLLHPRRMASHVLDEDLVRQSQPFTYLAVSAFAASVAVQYHGIQFVFEPAVRNLTPDLSVTRLVATTFPSIALIVFVGWLLAATISRTPERRRQIVELVCYSAGFQCLVVAVVSISVAVYFAAVGIPAGDIFVGNLVAALRLMAFWTGVAAYATLVPAAVLWRPVKANVPRSARGPRKWFTVCGLWVFSVVTLALGVIPGSVQRDLDVWAVVGAQAPEPELRCWIANATVDDNDWVTVQLILMGDDSTFWLIKKAPTQLAMKWDGRQQEFTGDVVAWSDSEAPVLALPPRTAKWVDIRFHVDDGWQSLPEKIRPPRRHPQNIEWLRIRAFQELSRRTASCPDAGSASIVQSK